MPFQSTDLADLASQFFQSPGNPDLADAGPAVRRIRDTLTHTEDRTRPFVATVFWQAFLFTPSFTFFLSQAIRDNPDLQLKLMQVVPHDPTGTGLRRFDLLILAEGLAKDDNYIYTDAKPTADEVRLGSEQFLDELRRGGADLKGLDTIEHPVTALEALSAQPFGILLLPAPRMLPAASLPLPPIKVSEPNVGATSTAGVHCVNANGKVGVTAAWHAVEDAINGMVKVDNHPGRVVSHDLITDSAFIEVGLQVSTPASRLKLLSNLPPRQHEPVTFDGAQSGHRSGKVTGWSPQLPAVSRFAQLVVTTNPISAQGDSGAALLDGQGILLGFCHEISEFGAVNPYSSWIWAESVFKGHDLA